MALTPGRRLGPYEIVAPLGAGGMGEVYRARDARLNRDVAIKALPEEFARDPERRARFDREARVLAALNHPNITAIYGVEQQDHSSYLVLELVEGQSLADRLAAGPIRLDDVLPIAAQIATGLEAAHDAGIVHRDLKPANVKIRPDGSVKILDLGLAKADDSASGQADMTQSPTVTSGGTYPGVILGTAAYMSPEQARGRPVDKRTDIFAFGCLLYECLTGRRAFRGEMVSDVLVAVITKEPDWSALPADTPEPLRDLLRRCLRKDPRQRLQAIGDARVVIEEISSASPSEVTAHLASKPLRKLVTRWSLATAAGVLVGLLGGLLAGGGLARRTVESSGVRTLVQAVLPLPAGVELGFGEGPAMALSPDGRTLVFRGVQKCVFRLYRRELGNAESVAIPGTEGGTAPFFSPDGEWLGFFAASRIKKVAMAGGAPLVVCEVPPVASGGTWSDDGWIIFSQGPNSVLSKVSPAGGAVESLTDLDRTRGEHAHVWPQALPGGGLLVTAVLGRDFQDLDSAQAVLLAPGAKPRVLVEGSSFARVVPGWIVFVRGDSLLAAPFDAERLEVTGPPVGLTEPIVIQELRRTAPFAVSRDGTLVFAAGPPLLSQKANVMRVDRSGTAVALPLGPAIYQMPRLSPGGARLAVARYEGMAGRLFVFEFERQVLMPLTPEPGRFFGPVWSPDGKQIAYAGFGEGEPRPYVKNADGSSTATPLTDASRDAVFPTSWFPDGKSIATLVAYTEAHGGTRLRGTNDIWILPVDRRTAPRPWFETTDRELAPMVSPDGKFLAYVSNESGRNEVYVRVYPGPGSKIQISYNGGSEPAWSREGRELLYREEDRFMSVEVRATSQIMVAPPRVLFTAPYQRGSREDIPRQYDVSRDGNVIVALQPLPSEPVERHLAVVTDWTRTLGRGAVRP